MGLLVLFQIFHGSEHILLEISNMTDDDLSTIETSIPTYAFKIQKKIEKLELSYRIKTFKKWLDSGKLLCRESYVLPPVITPSVTTDSIPYV